ncbi:MAG TPA: AI-2E family transporter, partial [Methylomirabilota bacterium]|nr:AI-2E family transporter [Methylomirabilota bacterium]
MPAVNQAGSPFYARVFGLAAAGVLAFALYRILEPFVGPILWDLLLAFLLVPANRRLRQALGGRRGAAAILLTLAVTLLVLVPVSVLAVVFARQAADLIGRLQDAAIRYQIAQASDLLRIPLLDRAIAWVGQVAGVTHERVEGWIVGGSKTFLQMLISLGGTFFAGALNAFVGLLLTLVLLFFFVRDGDTMVRPLLVLIPLDGSRKAHLVEHLSAVTRAVVLGTLVTALAQGALVGVALAIVGFPSAVVFGVLGAVSSLVPLVGTALVWVPAAGVLALGGRWGAALFMALWGVLVVSSADNFIRPRLISGRAQISTLAVLLGLLGGVGAFGAIGLFLGPLVVALVVALLRFAEEAHTGPAEWTVNDRGAH